jgi:hypothetical protein
MKGEAPEHQPVALGGPIRSDMGPNYTANSMMYEFLVLF